MHVHILYTINTTINAEPNFVWFSLSSFIHINNLQTWWRFVHEYVYSQWWYCADRSYAFLNMGRVRSRKYCASLSDMTTTWGLCREVDLRINLPRGLANVVTLLKEWLMWLVTLLGEGLCLQRDQFSSHHKSGNKIWQFKQWYIWTATIPLQIIAIWGAYYLARIPIHVHIGLLNEEYHYQTRSLFEVKTGWVRRCAMTMTMISPPPSWVSYPHSVCYELSVLILVLLLSFSPYAVLVAGQNLLRRCCSPMNQSSVNMITTDDENSSSFQCLGRIFMGQTKCWMNTS